MSQTSHVRILHSAERDDVSSFNSKTVCLCQSIKISYNKHVCKNKFNGNQMKINILYLWLLRNKKKLHRLMTRPRKNFVTRGKLGKQWDMKSWQDYRKGRKCYSQRFTRQHRYGSRAKEYNDDIEIRGYACERLFIAVDLNHVGWNACECSTIRDKTPLLAGTSVKANRVEVVWPWASYQIRINAGCACAGNVFPATAD